MPTTAASLADGDDGDATRAANAGGVATRLSPNDKRDEQLMRHPFQSGRPQLFSGLSPAEMDSISAASRALRKGRGQFVFMPGDRADCVYILKKGRIKLSVLAASGKEIAIDIIQPGEMFGEFALVDERSRSNMAQALDDVSASALDKRDFVRLLESLPKLALNYIRMVGDRRRRMEKKLSDITSKDVAARVCELLHELSAGDDPARPSGQTSLVPLVHHDIASLIGASRQTTTSVLNDLERRGIIELGRGWVRVKCLKNLQTYVGGLLCAALHIFFMLCQLADILAPGNQA
jgi:CRP/FNR family transcriptional regulator, cyclic AMP receptor protein